MRILLVGTLFLAACSSLRPAPADPQTIRECAALLPEGRTYTFEITGSVDATKPARPFSATTSVKTAAATPEQGAQDVTPFQSCMNTLVTR